ncbi:DUF4079 domain-containing protein [Leptothoe kymatousa]|uniref:DUF4079 domain-containing protein n=1 Tax=Leptothoe kymatousa TAU-MAC 1615 TaxID=2364775 RepID=A0ABS5XYA4_9CYAN|nr:DUF4079 domain-containing protein [Leptothoe kymatousa]MBT9310620.1 DUF4079 domain-containing protein [Leptothoe kymatousa TAU-MAC 1615]
MDLPSFIWLWRIAAWSMGLSLTLYMALLLTGGRVWYGRSHQQEQPAWLRITHLVLGGLLVALVLLLLSIGIVGTLGEHGSLGHSWHLWAGLTVVVLVLSSAIAASQIPNYAWARSLHVTLNALLLMAFLSVTYSGWTVVQQYLP